MKKNTLSRFVILAPISIAILAASAQDFHSHSSKQTADPTWSELVASMNQIHAAMHSVEPSGNSDACRESHGRRLWATRNSGAGATFRMTNGSFSRHAVSHSRMTNGMVQKGSGTTLVVQYQDGSKTISVPANVPMTQVAPEPVTFADGDIVYAATEKLPNGTLVTDKIFLIIPAGNSSR
jgi:hypothetical protein